MLCKCTVFTIYFVFLNPSHCGVRFALLSELCLLSIEHEDFLFVMIFSEIKNKLFLFLFSYKTILLVDIYLPYHFVPFLMQHLFFYWKHVLFFINPPFFFLI